MRTSELDMADSVDPADIDTFIDNATWAVCSTYNITHSIKSLTRCSYIWTDMLFNIPFVADWKQI